MQVEQSQEDGHEGNDAGGPDDCVERIYIDDCGSKDRKRSRDEDVLFVSEQGGTISTQAVSSADGETVEVMFREPVDADSTS